MMRELAAAMIIGALALPALALADSGPVFSPNGPDASGYGADLGYPTALPYPLLPQRYMVGDYSRFDRLLSSHRVARPTTASVLHRAPEELAIRYAYAGGSHTLADYLDRDPATGLLIARDDTILFEHYQYSRTDQDRLLSQSMAKTITALLVGIAVSEGAIHSIEQTAAAYVPELAGTEFGATRVSDLLHMASGMAFSETYDGSDDNAAFSRALFVRGSPGAAKIVARYNTRAMPAGTRFHYAGINTEILGLIVTNATRTTLAAYLQSRIWQPMGAEADASWVTDSNGQEAAFCCFSATLRDWARLGLVLAHDGAWNGRQIIPRDWLIASTTPAAAYLAPGGASPLYGYGNQIWLLPGPRRQFALLGIHGQTIFVDPTAKLVLVHTGVRVKATAGPDAAELRALWHAVVAHFAD